MSATESPRWTRAVSLRQLADSEPFDVVVVGGGILGAASALDAAARGLRVALVEQLDFAAETSSRSTKLLHGGIRYLPHFEFGLVREGLLEQKVLIRTADFLYSPLEFAVPIYRGRGMADLPKWASHPKLLPIALRIGLTLYDTLGSRDERHQRIDRDELLELVPTLRSDDLRGGFLYGDAQTDDARLTVSLLKTAVMRHGAVVVNGTRADSIDRANGGFTVRIRDVRGDEQFDISTKSVISATWAFRPPSIAGGHDPVPMRLSKGAHLLFDAEPLGIGDLAVVLPETDDDRVLFIVPWRGMALLGTTDTPYEGPPGDAVADDEDVEYLMRHLHAYLDLPDVEPVASFAGVRALVGEGGETSKASRHHQVIDLTPGYVQLVGGKLTAHRPIAADAVDRICEHLGIDAASTTETEFLVGAGLGDTATSVLSGELEQFDLPAGYAGELIARYGTESCQIVDLLHADPNLVQLVGGGRFTLAEIAYGVRHESSASIADAALRRTHLAWVTPDHGRKAAEPIAEVLGTELGWSDEQRTQHLRAFEAALVEEGL